MKYISEVNINGKNASYVLFLIISLALVNSITDIYPAIEVDLINETPSFL